MFKRIADICSTICPPEEHLLTYTVTDLVRRATAVKIQTEIEK